MNITTEKSLETSKPAVPHLSIEQAEDLLYGEGIPRDELYRYRSTVYAANASFWRHLFLLERIGGLIVSNGRVFKRRVSPRSGDEPISYK